MTLAPDLLAEFEIISMFNLANTLEGLKVHQDAGNRLIDAAQRLHAKGLTSQPDGGYLTSLGLEAAEHAQGLLTILAERQAA
ncbi:TIGR02647 family protein [Pseudomonas typographi]|uniref:TIGR02647 family protein n=1 Tax=Pseudomonas typographi TaxID=2715964 RepID=A0ABR7Z3I6_9PSED|nr:TIGR02647 family protein [Pseudomonas typographi]MBD1550185.1 TIGR02647 family protein [Pseudomonas typographi]MBD1586055.1 TIGR02647 family protein [Pseudomonas typographi]MBD1599913.1 TIGR02647 family protein [Pseudomonas typographi]